MNDMLTKQERVISVFRNLQGWSWDIYPTFTLEREDINVVLPILYNHIIHHTKPYDDNDFGKLYDTLSEVIKDINRPSYKATQRESELLQVVLGDFL